ncbi:hypothetical protein QUF72_10125 [Desulfobacterales bacterium HSG2]|nr:hypothetical protein [Desulfobacterales bacterium HSG2]
MENGLKFENGNLKMESYNLIRKRGLLVNNPSPLVRDGKPEAGRDRKT